MDGIVVINKPYGITSHQAVQSVRRLFNGSKAGHSGTLDPIATGVLPVCLGRATRLVEYIIEHPKSYRAALTLGKTTDTDDSAGQVIDISAPPILQLSQLKEILSKFQGDIEQLPPRYSAVKYKGKPLYRWARKGKEVPRKIRQAKIYEIKLLEYNPEREPQLVFDVKCSKGTYIRTLAYDMGQVIGCGGHLFSLSRLAVGPFIIDNSYSPEQLTEMKARGQIEDSIWPMDSALAMMPALVLGDEKINALKNGQLVYLKDLTGQGFSDISIRDQRQDEVKKGLKVRIYDCQNYFKAIGQLDHYEEGFMVKTLKFLSA